MQSLDVINTLPLEYWHFNHTAENKTSTPFHYLHVAILQVQIMPFWTEIVIAWKQSTIIMQSGCSS